MTELLELTDKQVDTVREMMDKGIVKLPKKLPEYLWKKIVMPLPPHPPKKVVYSSQPTPTEEQIATIRELLFKGVVALPRRLPRYLWCKIVLPPPQRPSEPKKTQKVHSFYDANMEMQEFIVDPKTNAVVRNPKSATLLMKTHTR